SATSDRGSGRPLRRPGLRAAADVRELRVSGNGRAASPLRAHAVTPAEDRISATSAGPRAAGGGAGPRRVGAFGRLRSHAHLLRPLPKSTRWAIRRRIVGPPVRRHTAACTDVTFVGVTGSLGKTTTKDLIAAALATEG